MMTSKQVRDVVFIAHRYIVLVAGLLASAITLTGSLLIISDWTAPLFESITGFIMWRDRKGGKLQHQLKTPVLSKHS
jgi:uncharacterized iron-regulated membrane protein